MASESRLFTKKGGRFLLPEGYVGQQHVAHALAELEYSYSGKDRAQGSRRVEARVEELGYLQLEDSEESEEMDVDGTAMAREDKDIEDDDDVEAVAAGSVAVIGFDSYQRQQTDQDTLELSEWPAL
eukprot:CAMPEP_0206475086 /NCGR_PEP_ID=MMETSP0324_2-20121206/33871_1 /ASSEMBLY_ACC=CAM_ASM_000836 /TAXON_ID=2866 /ORGANISM="Crypthecodinium cohnii, Strain Seligo" /LENGTH=125 /DNA_ID=CAMNT_0053950379 /DNA_START=336 /DNA_END=714 /DNA_ORIENTATION=+